MPRISLPKAAAAPLLALALTAGPAALAAQIGNQSDHSGPVVTGGGLIGFLPVVTRPTRNAPLVNRNGRIHYGSTRVACSVSTAADSLLNVLGEGRLSPSRSFAGRTIPAPAQGALRALVHPVGVAPVDSVAFAAALVRPAGGDVPAPGAAAERARELTAELHGMLNGSESCQAGKGTVPAEQLAHAMDAYGAFVGAAPGAVLRNPSGELLAVQALLEDLALAAVNAAR
jgi:hypothetical protein